MEHSRVVIVNGHLLPADAAHVSVTDRGLTLGHGVFETIRVDEGAPFALSRHLRRLRAAAGHCGLDCPPATVLAEEVHALLAADQLLRSGRVRVRLTLTAGPDLPGGPRGVPGPTRIVSGGQVPTPHEPVTLLLVDWRRGTRTPTTGVKATSYLDSVLALGAAQRHGAAEALLLSDRGHLSEASRANIFLISRRRLRTPSLASGCLPGVTRGLVCEWFAAAEDRLTLGHLRRGEEAFLTSSLRGVRAVGEVRTPDGTVIWRARDGGLGGRTEEIRREFERRAAADRDP